MDYQALLRDGTKHVLRDAKMFADDVTTSQFLNVYSEDDELLAMFHLGDVVWIKRIKSAAPKPTDDVG